MKRAKIDHDGPSAESLREIPPVNPETSVPMGRGPEGMRRAMAFSRAVRGRPRKGQRAVGSSARSVRLSDEAWAEIDRVAAERQMPVARLLAWILAEWVYAPKMKSRDERRALAASKPFKGKSRVKASATLKSKAQARLDELSAGNNNAAPFKGKARVRKRPGKAAA